VLALIVMRPVRAAIPAAAPQAAAIVGE
jgi:hypothetical protein